jgi:hypothetical protein
MRIGTVVAQLETSQPLSAPFVSALLFAAQTAHSSQPSGSLADAVATCRVQQLASELQQDIVFIWCHAPRAECFNRVMQQSDDTQQRRAARLQFIQHAADRLFAAVAGEDAEQVLSALGDCSSCRRLKVGVKNSVT